MSGINVFFHAFSALAAAFLVWWALRLKRERDFVRELLASGAPGAPRRLHVEAPPAFLARFAAALGIPFEGGTGGAPARIDPAPLVDLFLRRGIALIRCQEGGAAVELHVRGPGDEPAAPLAAALGSQVTVLPHRSPP